MSKPMKFSDLDVWLEADEAGKAKPNIKSIKPPTGSTLAAGAQVAGRGFKDLAKQVIFNPAELGRKVGSATGYDVMRGAYEGQKTFRKEVKAQRAENLHNYFIHLAMPNGWPKKGSPFRIITAYNGEYNGAVTNQQSTGKHEETYTIIAKPVKPEFPRLAIVISLDTQQLPFYALKKFVVSNITPDNKYIKNDRESGHSQFSFDYENAIFVLDAKAERATETSILVDATNKSKKPGDEIEGIDVASEQSINGTILKRYKRTVDGKEVELFKVKFMPSSATAVRPAARTAP